MCIQRDWPETLMCLRKASRRASGCSSQKDMFYAGMRARCQLHRFLRFDVTFAVNCAFDHNDRKTKPPEKPVPRRSAWWRWGRVELPVQTNPSKNVLQA